MCMPSILFFLFGMNMWLVGGLPGATNIECDDALACTEDFCVQGVCRHNRSACVCAGVSAPFKPWVLESDLDGIETFYWYGDDADALIVLGSGFFIEEAILHLAGGITFGKSVCAGNTPFGIGGAFVTYVDDEWEGSCAGADWGKPAEYVAFDCQDDLTKRARAHCEDGTMLLTAVFVRVWDECSFRFDPTGQLIEAQLTLIFSLLHDFDCDQSVDAQDWFHFSACQYGPEEANDLGCERFDANADGDVDLRDVASIQRLFTGSSE